MGATTTPMTAEQYYAVTVEGDRTQLIDGAIVVNEPGFAHALLQTRLLVALDRWASSEHGHGLALLPTDVRLDEHNVFAPDVIWFAHDYRPPPGRTYPDRVPDLCVEIRSPGTWRYDVGVKKSAYERAGLPELWLVDDAAEAVLVYARSAPGAPAFDVALELARGDELRSGLLGGFALRLDELFAG